MGLMENTRFVIILNQLGLKSNEERKREREKNGFVLFFPPPLFWTVKIFLRRTDSWNQLERSSRFLRPKSHAFELKLPPFLSLPLPLPLPIPPSFLSSLSTPSLKFLIILNCSRFEFKKKKEEIIPNNFLLVFAQINFVMISRKKNNNNNKNDKKKK